MTPSQVAGLLQIHSRTVCRLAENGKIPGIRIGRSWRFHNKDILNITSNPKGKRHISDPDADEEQIQRQRDRLDVLREIGLATVSTLDLNSVLDIMMEKISLLVPDAAILVLLTNRETGVLERSTCRNINDREWKERKLESMPPIPKLAMQNKTPVMVDNVQIDPRTQDPEFFRKHGFFTLLAVPLIAKSETLGVLNVLLKEECPFSEEETQFLSTIAGQTAIAVHDSRLYEQARHRTDELSALYAVTATASATLNLDTLLQEVIKRITEIFHFDATRIFLFDAKMDELHLQASFEVQPGFWSSRPGNFRLGQGSVGKVAESGEAIIFENVQSDSRYQKFAANKTALKEGFNFFAVFPIKSKSRTVGTISCIGKNPRHLTPSEKQLIESMASQIGVAVENASLYRESQRREEIQGLLKELSQDITSLEINRLLKKLTEKVRGLFHVDIVDVRVLEGKSWRLKCLSGIDLDAMPTSRTGILQGRSGWIARNRKVLMLPDINQGVGIASGKTLERLGVRGYLGAPLFSRGGEVVGVLRALSYQPREFTGEEMELLQQLANGTAIAVENARLFQQIQQKSGEIRKLNEDLEQRVFQRTAELETANKELEAFSYSVSHDLRAPLRAIDGFSRILLEDYVLQLAPEAQRYLHLVRDNAQQMGRLIDDLLAFARMSRQALSKQPVVLGDLLHQVINDLRSEQTGRHIEIDIGDLPVCQADPNMLKLVFVNLLSNAFKFTRRREVAVIQVGFETINGDNILFVKDNGVGFDMQYAGKLFGVFQRLHRAEEYEGTGVGLATVDRIIQRHGGRVWAEASVDHGATFYFNLTGGQTRG